jgi:hypothetical protein
VHTNFSTRTILDLPITYDTYKSIHLSCWTPTHSFFTLYPAGAPDDDILVIFDIIFQLYNSNMHIPTSSTFHPLRNFKIYFGSPFCDGTLKPREVISMSAAFILADHNCAPGYSFGRSFQPPALQ